MMWHRTVSVDAQRMNLGRSSIILVTLLAWFAISNHCALATLGPHQPAEHHACHGEDAPSPAKKSNDDSPCCKTLRATLVAAAKVMPTPSFVVPPSFPADIAPVPTDTPLLLDTFDDTGPPRQPSFAELVLQHCVLTHAPPRVA
ncbi:MAG: hypothetical protein ABI946_05735 [Chthoniobacterales bacterium]